MLPCVFGLGAGRTELSPRQMARLWKTVSLPQKSLLVVQSKHLEDTNPTSSTGHAALAKPQSSPRSPGLGAEEQTSQAPGRQLSLGAGTSAPSTHGPTWDKGTHTARLGVVHRGASVNHQHPGHLSWEAGAPARPLAGIPSILFPACPARPPSTPRHSFPSPLLGQQENSHYPKVKLAAQSQHSAG